MKQKDYERKMSAIMTLENKDMYHDFKNTEKNRVTISLKCSRKFHLMLKCLSEHWGTSVTATVYRLMWYGMWYYDHMRRKEGQSSLSEIYGKNRDKTLEEFKEIMEKEVKKKERIIINNIFGVDNRTKKG